MYTDDPVRDAMHRDRETQEWLDSLPVCACCRQPIQDKRYFEIEDVSVCSDCLRDYCEEEYLVKNTAL